MNLVIESQGTVRCLYGEAIALHCLGDVKIHRASQVEPDTKGQWWANLGPLDGPILGPFARRSEAIQAETQWLELNWLCPEICTQS